MVIPVVNIALGIGIVVGGATGKLAFLGSAKPELVVGVGAVVAMIGVFQLVRRMREPRY